MLVYTHIPKCAGVKVKSVLRRPGFHGLMHNQTAHKYENSYKFVTIRHPITWYASMWNFKVVVSKNRPSKGYNRMANNLFEDFFKDVFLMGERFDRWFKPKNNFTNNIIKHANKNIGFFSNCIIFYLLKDHKSILESEDIINYVIDNYDDLTIMNKVVRIERLKEDMQQVLDDNGISMNMAMFDGYMNHVGHRQKAENLYTDEMKNLVFERDRIIIDLFYNNGKTKED